MVSKSRPISRSGGFPAGGASCPNKPSPSPLSLAKGRDDPCSPYLNPLNDCNSQLTCSFFALNTGNVFARSTRYWRAKGKALGAAFGTTGCRRSSASQKNSQEFHLARDKRAESLLSRGVRLRAEP